MTEGSDVLYRHIVAAIIRKSIQFAASLPGRPTSLMNRLTGLSVDFRFSDHLPFFLESRPWRPHAGADCAANAGRAQLSLSSRGPICRRAPRDDSKPILQPESSSNEGIRTRPFQTLMPPPARLNRRSDATTTSSTIVALSAQLPV
jgi:hypothetical protein